MSDFVCAGVWVMCVRVCTCVIRAHAWPVHGVPPSGHSHTVFPYNSLYIVQGTQQLVNLIKCIPEVDKNSEYIGVQIYSNEQVKCITTLELIKTSEKR